MRRYTQYLIYWTIFCWGYIIYAADNSPLGLFDLKLPLALLMPNSEETNHPAVEPSPAETEEVWHPSSLREFRAKLFSGPEGAEIARDFVVHRTKDYTALPQKGERAEAAFWQHLVAMVEDPHLGDLAWTKDVQALAHQEHRTDIEFLCVVAEIAFNFQKSGDVMLDLRNRLSKLSADSGESTEVLFKLWCSLPPVDQESTSHTLELARPESAEAAAAQINLASSLITAAEKELSLSLDASDFH